MARFNIQMICHAPPSHLLLYLMRDPRRMAELDLPQWNFLLPQARSARLLGRLAAQAKQLNLIAQLPSAVCHHLEAASRMAEKYRSMMLWEIRHLRNLLAPVTQKLVLLKGAAYLAAGLPLASGRLFSDVDILVPKPDLAAVEQALLEAGWQPLKLHPYDQRYYRSWMHELPPLEHKIRHTTLDVHHNILPETGRLHPDPEKLLAEAVPLPNAPLYVLSPVDMFLHTAVHLFQDGEIGGALRDLVDLTELFRHFANQPDFLHTLLPRAKQLDLTRPLWYALDVLRWAFPDLLPDYLLEQAKPLQPPWPIRPLMHLLIRRAILPELPHKPTRFGQLARWLLYLRAHWLRMPPQLLFPHLVHKTLRRFRPQEQNP